MGETSMDKKRHSFLFTDTHDLSTLRQPRVLPVPQALPVTITTRTRSQPFIFPVQHLCT